MAINPLDKVFLSDDDNSTGKQKLESLAAGGSITSGSDTYIADETAIYLTTDTSVLFEAQVLTPEQQAQARANIGAGSGGTEVYVNSVLQSTLSFDSDPQTQISAKVPNTRTIADIDLQDNITKSELLTALNVEDGAEVNEVNDVEIDDVSCVTGTTAEIRTINGDYNASTNRLATASDISPIKSVSVDNTALTPDANGNIDVPKATNNNYGVVKIAQGRGLDFLSDGGLYVDVAGNTQITNRTTGRPIATAQLNFAVKSALTDANHLTMTSSEQTVAQEVLGIPSAISNPNLLINGDFRINQRGGANYTTARKYTADRWINREASLKVTPSSSGGVTLTKVTATSDVTMLSQTIEDYEPLLGKTVTLSMKLKSNNVTGGVALALYQANNAYYATSSIGEQLFESTGLCSLTVTIPSSLSYSLLNFVIRFNSDAIVNEACEIEYVKLEIGSVATPFSPRPYAEELSMCQRYYIKPISGTYQYVASGSCFSTTRAIFALSTPTTMRANPTVTRTNIYALITNSAKALSSLTASTRPNCLQLIGDFTGGTAGYAAILASDSSSAELSFDAEIY